jgi:SAM-dependent methyltransferase
MSVGGDDRTRQVRPLWWRTIRDLSASEARSALLQVLAEIDEHWAKEHEEDGSPEDLGIPPDEYLTELIRRIRPNPPPAGMNEDGHFGEEVAARYDGSSDPMFAPEVVEPTVDFLAQLATGGRALEFAIGTGRIALPLAERGVDVHGIELSRAMVTQLRAKPGGEDIGVAIGDMATAKAPGSYRLVYLVFNTIMNLTTQEAQAACFRNAAEHLEPGGCFVIEVGVPDLRRLPPGQTHVVFDLSDGHVGIDEYDVGRQGLVSHHFTRRGDVWELSSGPFRYVWPHELDLMATATGLRLRERWSGWRREPFTSESRSHVSVWEKLG